MLKKYSCPSSVTWNWYCNTRGGGRFWTAWFPYGTSTEYKITSSILCFLPLLVLPPTSMISAESPGKAPHVGGQWPHCPLLILPPFPPFFLPSKWLCPSCSCCLLPWTSAHHSNKFSFTFKWLELVPPQKSALESCCCFALWSVQVSPTNGGLFRERLEPSRPTNDPPDLTHCGSLPT